MNGAIAEPPPITMSTPINNNTTITGKSHHFLRSFKKLKRSDKKSIDIKFEMCLRALKVQYYS